MWLPVILGGLRKRASGDKIRAIGSSCCRYWVRIGLLGSRTVNSAEKESTIGEEYYVFVFDTFTETKDLHNVKAAKPIGRLTPNQYDYLCKEFKSLDKFGIVRFIPKGSVPMDDKFESRMLLGKVTELLGKKNESNWFRQWLINTAADTANKIRTRDGCEHENVVMASRLPGIVDESLKEPTAIPPTGTVVAELASIATELKAFRVEMRENTDKLTEGIGREMQDALGMYNDPINENEFEFAQRLKRTCPNKTYEELAALVGERFPDGKYQAGDGEKLRKALNPPKTNRKNRKKNGNL